MARKNNALRRSTGGGKIGLETVVADRSDARGNGVFRMASTRRWITLGLVLAAPGLLAHSLLAQTDQDAAPTTPPHHKSHKTRKELILPPLPRGPLSQLPMDQLPPTPAQVSYQGGLLTISAQNSTLGEILRDVHSLTGAAIEIPPGPAANERVVANLGPGEPRDVLAGLLNGSQFNYVMLGSNSDPAAVASVLLTSKGSSSRENEGVANMASDYDNKGTFPPAPQPFTPPFPLRAVPQPGQPGYVQPGSATPGSADADDSKDEDDKDDDDADDQTPAAQPNANPQDQQQSDQPNAGPKTAEQILQMLRKPQQPGGQPVPPTQQPPEQ